MNQKPFSSDIRRLSNQDKHRMTKNLQSIEPAEEGVGNDLTTAAESARKVLSEVATPFKRGTQTAEEYVTNEVTTEQLLTGMAKKILEQLFKKYKVSELVIIPGIIQAAIEASKKGEEFIFLREDNAVQALQQVLQQSTSDQKSNAMNAFIKIAKDTDSVRELNRALYLSDKQSIKVFSKLSKQGECMSDIVHNLQVEHSFNTDEGEIITAGIFHGALRDIYEGMEQTNDDKEVSKEGSKNFKKILKISIPKKASPFWWRADKRQSSVS